MEESLSKIVDTFSLSDMDVTQLSPLVLAYIGDGVYEFIVRTYVVFQGNRQVNKMHKDSANLVKAATQAKMVKLVCDDLMAEELSVYRRGRNANSHTMAKNASMTDYRHATGFEALMGYLYLSGDFSRAVELVDLAWKKMNEVKGEVSGSE
ncbi:MAG: ribonuclease III [Lachnospiraceae bacterium]|nr:ribonuclease III [Lachnospiraceae bacterium]